LEAQAVLEQVLTDVLNNPELQTSRDWYGTPGDRRLVLLIESTVPWPGNWRPKIPGYIVEFQTEATPVLDFLYWNVPGGVEIVSHIIRSKPRQLAISLNKLNLQPERAYDDQISLSLFNIGGTGGEDAAGAGGCIVLYNVSDRAGKLLAEYAGSFRP
jgi:hypothetical protein